ncbi:MarR family winged helix-turn-helix transcriptional regulator [Corynebacterium pacaense]|uniref:MarR family winged helix-turn-helix transcriptional regulator n=1 Tax=Corynebacterium pacaense TaxID=1816684 RepID=UPI0009B96FF4|nr:MarR family transcriptional regulator [Corynebacterium pacaense]
MRDEQNSPDTQEADALQRNLYDVDSSDPASELIDRSDMDPADVAQIGRVMKALVALRDTERALGIASAKYMKLSTQDMRALHFIMVANNHGDIVTPGILGSHLKISPASVTKMLNRLEKGGHIIRSVHPVDRRAFSLEVTPETRATATRTLGKHQARRFHAAARLTPDEREAVIRFLYDMAEELSLDNADWAFEDPVKN